MTKYTDTYDNEYSVAEINEIIERDECPIDGDSIATGYFFPTQTHDAECENEQCGWSIEWVDDK